MPGPDPNAAPVAPASRVWITLITRASYLPGVVILVHTLQKHNSKHAIIVQYTASLEEDCVATLRKLNTYYPLMRLQYVKSVPLPDGLNPVAKRFDDTLTKLRAFEPLDDAQPPIEPPLEQVPVDICFLDADIAIYRNMDDIFDIPRPGPDWIAAHHACVCNIDSDPWAPPEWNPSNCANNAADHPEALAAPMPSSSKDGARPTFQLLNSGVFVCTPSHNLWRRIQKFLHEDPRVKTFTFPDQHFLDEFFRDHWVAIGWQYNAFKTHRYWHANAWRDDEVRALHYIVDKPWEAKVKADGTAGYLGRDGETHKWWWKEYDGWEQEMEKRCGDDVVGDVKKHVCVDSKLGETRFKK